MLVYHPAFDIHHCIYRVMKLRCNLSAKEESISEISIPDPSTAFNAVKKHLEGKAKIWDWTDDVEFVGLSWVCFK